MAKREMLDPWIIEQIRKKEIEDEERRRREEREQPTVPIGDEKDDGRTPPIGDEEINDGRNPDKNNDPTKDKDRSVVDIPFYTGSQK